MGFFESLTMLNLGPSSVVLPVYVTVIMRESPLARHGSACVPTPLDPAGQSSRSLGAGAAVGGGATGAAAATEALGLEAGASFFASSSQAKSTVASTKSDTSLDD